MKFLKTIISHDQQQLDREVSKFLNQETVESVSFSISSFPVAAAPVNIPGFQEQRTQVSVQTIFSAFLIYDAPVTAPGAAAPGIDKIIKN